MSLTTLRYDDALVISPTRAQAYMTCPQLAAWMQRYPLRSPLISKGLLVARILKALHTNGRLPADDDALTTMCHNVSFLTRRHTKGTTLHAELRLGPCRIDQVLIDANRHYFIIDYKYIPQITPLTAETFTAPYQQSHQLYHYAWAFSQYVGLWDQDAFTITIGVTVFTDDPIHKLCGIATWEIDKAALLQWLENSVKLWHTIRTNVNTYRNMEACHYQRYGRCYYYERCWGET